MTTAMLLGFPLSAYAAAPTAVDDNAGTQEDNAVTIFASANDFDVDGDLNPASAIVDDQASNGTAISNGNGSFNYTPNLNFNGNDSFDYEICDFALDCDVATVNVNVSAVNDNPVANNDVANVNEDSSGNVIDVSNNDTDVDGDNLNVSAASANNGSASPNGGNVNYTPNAGYVGPDSISYTISDGNGGSDSATVSVTVTNTNDPPVANDDVATVDEDSNNNQIIVTGNDTDADGDDLDVISASANNGTVSPQNDRVRYSPNANYFGADLINYTISDGNGGSDSAIVSVTVNNINDAPVAVGDTATVPEDSTNNVINVTGNDSDADGDALTATAASASNGSVSTSGVNVIYTPAVGYVGADTISYTVSDGNGGSDNGSVAVTVSNVNDAPTANDDVASVDEDSVNNIIDVTQNDTDPDGDTLFVVSASANNGSASGQAGNVRYSPNAGYVGPDVITYTIADGNGATDSAIVSVTVNNVNDAPVAVNDVATVVEDSSDNSINVTLNDTDADGDTLTVTLASANNGTAAPNGGSVTYTPNPDFFGADTINYTISDGNGGFDSATVAMTVTGLADAPVANDDSATVDEDSTDNVIDVTANDTDADGDTLTVTAASAANGTVTPNGGTVRYSPDANYFGSDTINYTISDGNGGTDSAIVSVTVNGINDLPVIETQVVVPLTTVEDTSLLLTLADITVSDEDDTYPDDFTLDVRPGTGYSVSGDTITPDLDFNGTLNVSVRVNDGEDNSDPFTLIVDVTPVNDAPRVSDQAALSMLEDSSLLIQITDLTVVDPDNDPVDLSLTVMPGDNFTVALNSITPDLNFNGALVVPVIVSDGLLDSPPFNLTVEVTAVNDAPLLLAPIGDQQATENSLFELDISANFTDVDGDALTYSAVELPAVFTLDEQSGMISGTPAFEDTQDLPFAVMITATDGDGELANDTFAFTVAALGRANVDLLISAAPDPALLNDQVLWTFTTGNTGPETATSLEVSGSFVGQGLTVAPGVGVVCVIDPPAGQISAFTCTMSDVPIGGSSSAVISTTTGTAGDVFVSATAAITELLPIDPNLDNNSLQASIGVAEAYSNGTVQTLGSANAGGFAAGDVNGDGFVDLVVGTAAGQSVEIYLSTGFRTFVDAPTLVPENALTEGVALADIDNDSDLDLIFANGGGQADSVYANDGAGAFSLVATLAATFSHDVAAADVDGDGNFDLVFAAAMGNPVYMGDGAGGFTQREMLGTRNSHAVAIADLNGNGRPDLAFANEASPSSIWINSAGTSFATPTDLTTGDAADVAAADLDGNGSPDLVFARLRGTATDVPANPIYANDGNGVFTLLTALGAAASTGVQVGDVDGDGIVDLVFVNANGVHQIWRGSGGAYTLYREQIVAQGGACGVLADLGNDGGLDLALGGATVTGSDVFLNDGFGNLGKGDAVPPVLTLLGDELVDVPSGGNYTDGGATAEDNIDGDISASIVATNMVNTAVVGTYTVTYNVTDIAGNPATPITRTVNVTPAVGTGGGGGGALDPAQLLLLLLASIAAYRARRAIIRSGA